MTKQSPVLHIVTGPPGSGKSSFAKERNLPIYDNDLQNKNGFKHAHPKVEAVLTVTAPTVEQKTKWIKAAEKYGYAPRLYCIYISKMEAYTRMKQRSGDSAHDGAGHSNTADKWVHYWYKNYKRHPQEERITNVRKACS